MPTIRIDHEVWAWLKGLARPLEDTPNSILRRVARLNEDAGPDDGPVDGAARARHLPMISRGNGGRGQRRSPRRVYSGLTGRQLNIEWKVNAKHALYSKDGDWYNHLEYFPGALFDPNGYVLFKTEEQYRNTSLLRHGKQLDVPGGIASMPGYVRIRRST